MPPIGLTQLEGKGFLDADRVGQPFMVKNQGEELGAGRSNQNIQYNDLLFLTCT